MLLRLRTLLLSIMSNMSSKHQRRCLKLGTAARWCGEKLTATGDFANAEHVELTNIGTAANALVASNASEIDAYSLVTDFAGGTVSVDEAIAILAAENANAVTGKNH